MKKFFAAMILAVTLLLCQNPAQAAAVRLCDSSVESVISVLNRAASEFNTSIWGKEYYTYQGARRCELHFGNSVENTIRFRLNNDNTVARALVIVGGISDLSRATMESSVQASIMALAILLSTGMSESEAKSLTDRSMDSFFDALNRNPYMTHYHEKTSVWCSSIQRYVVWDYEVSETPEPHIDIYLYAHD